MEWKYIKELKDINNIEKFEQILEIKLPEDYMEYIKKYNGSRPGKKLFQCENGDEHMIKTFLSFNPEDIENIFKYYEALKMQLPKGYFPIASDPGGNFIIYNREFKLYYWNHENNKKEFIANNFKELIEKLY